MIEDPSGIRIYSGEERYAGLTPRAPQSAPYEPAALGMFDNWADPLAGALAGGAAGAVVGGPIGAAVGGGLGALTGGAVGEQIRDLAGQDDWTKINEAAFALYNDMQNAVDYVNRPVYPEEAGHNPLDIIKDTPYEADYLDNFVHSRSSAETRSIMARIDRENGFRELYARSGWRGLVSGVAAGVISPTVLLPVVGWLGRAGKLAKGGQVLLASGEAALATAGAVGIQEAVLQATQETRTAEETLWNIGGAAIVGGLLGGAIGLATRAQMDRIAGGLRGLPAAADADAAYIEALARGEAPGPAAAGAQATYGPRGTGELAPMAGADKTILAEQDRRIRLATSEVTESRLVGDDLAENVLTRRDSGEGITQSNVEYSGPVESKIRQANARLVPALEAVDEAWLDYYFGKQVRFGPLRAQMQRLTGRDGGKLQYEEFKEQVSIAAISEDKHPIPQVEKAASEWRKLEKSFTQEAIDAGFPGYTRDMKPQSGDKSYLHRIYDVPKILADMGGVRAVLARAAERSQTKQRAKLDAWKAKTVGRIQEQIADLELTGEARAALLADLDAQQKALREGGKRFASTDEKLEGMRSRLKAEIEAAAKAGSNDPYNASSILKSKQDVADTVRAAGKEYADYTAARNALASRLRRVRGNVEGRGDQVEALRAKIADTEAANVDRLWRMHNAATKLEAEMADMSPEAIAEELAGLRTQFAQVMERSTAAQERLARANEKRAADLKSAVDAGDAKKADALQRGIDRGDPFMAEAKAVDEMNDLAARISEIEEIDPQLAATELRMLIERRVAQAAQVVEDAGKRMQALQARAAKADPAAVKARVAALRERAAMVEARAGSDFANMTPKEIGEAMTDLLNKIVGHSQVRGLTEADLSPGPRGALQKRTLNFVSTEELMPWMVRDIEQIMRRYTRTMASDLAMYRKTGSVNGTSLFERINAGYDRKINAIIKNVSDEKLQKTEVARLNKARAADLRDTKEMIDILRGNNAVPSNPNAMSYRINRGLTNLNYLRLGGGFTLSSLTDPANLIAEYGIARVLGTAWRPFVQGLKGFRLSAKDAKLGGALTEMALDTRARSFAGLEDNFGLGASKFERGLEAASSKYGLVTLLAPWTQLTKTWATGLAQTRMLEWAEAAAKGGKLTRKQTAILADNYLTPADVKVVGEQFLKHGGTENGIRYANTEAWDKGTEAVAGAYQRGLAKEIDKVIPTPGLDKPSWMTGNNALFGQLGPVIGQFQSFGMATTQRVLMARLQRKDAAALIGTAMQIAAGAMITFLIRGSRGQPMPETPQAWVAAGIDRSGVLGWLMTANHFSEQMTQGKVGMAALTGGSTRRYASQNMFSDLLGPTADLIETGFRVGGAPFREGGVSGNDVHALRTLLPMQNLIGLSVGFDAVEAATSNALGLKPRTGPRRTVTLQ